MLSTNKPFCTFAEKIPTREVILAVLRQANGPVSEKKLISVLGIKKQELGGFNKRLAAMQRDGQIKHDEHGNFVALSTSNFISGIVIGHRNGYGFVRRDDNKGDDIFVDKKDMYRLMHGDRVLVNFSSSHKTHRFHQNYRVVEVVERYNKKIIGRLFCMAGQWVVNPSDTRIPQLIEVPKAYLLGACENDMVEVEIIHFPEKYTLAIGRILSIIGIAGEVKTEIEVVIRKFKLPCTFSLEIEKYAAQFNSKAPILHNDNYEDLRHLPFVTIDDVDARDFDDAIYCTQSKYNDKLVSRLLVAIADVSHYVQSGDPIDQEALKRSCSVYFPQFVIPMLPEVLSNQLCSLQQNVDRLVLICDALIDSNGEILHYKFYPSIICSAARLTYDEVTTVFKHHDVWNVKKYKQNEKLDFCQSNNFLLKNGVEDSLKQLRALFQILSKARFKRGAISFETADTFIVYDKKNGKIEKIIPRQRNEAHKLVEECMLVANICAADFLTHFNHPTLYRIHSGPLPAKLKLLRIYLNEMGLELGGGNEPMAKDYTSLMVKIKNRKDFPLLQTILLRSLQQAFYSSKNTGHFGLACSAYTHFTSPIRRYPDLLVHRSIHAILASKRYNPVLHCTIDANVMTRKFIDKNHIENNEKQDHILNSMMLASELQRWEELGVLCSKHERRAEEAARDIEAWFKCCWMKDKVGKVFNAVVSGVASFGLFVTLKQSLIEGLIHISTINKGNVRFDEDRYQLIHDASGRVFTLQDDLIVQVKEVDVDQRKIFFQLVNN